MKPGSDPFEFDGWRDLAADDPQAFEDARERVLNSLIESAPVSGRRRLRGLQWQIDRVRERAGNPLAACFRISDMMWDRVLGEDGLVAHVEQLTGARPRPASPPRSADILAFARTHRDS